MSVMSAKGVMRSYGEWYFYVNVDVEVEGGE